MDMSPERNELGNNLRFGPEGVIQQIMDYADTSGWRVKKIVKEVITNRQTQGPDYDTGVLTKMKRLRKLKLLDSDMELVTKMIRTGSGLKWTVCVVNHVIKNGDCDRDVSNVVTHVTVSNTLKDKYDGKSHKHKKKGTGSRDKTSIWWKTRNDFCTQLW